MTIWRAVVTSQLFGVASVRNMFTGQGQLVNPDELDDIFTPYLDGIYTPIVYWCHGSFATLSYEVFQWTPPNWISQATYTFYHPGTQGGDALANQMAGVLIAKAVGLRRIGRKFFAGLGEAAVSGNQLIANAATAFATALVAYLASVTTPGGSTMAPGILTKTGVFYPFTSGVVSSLLGTMRRRKPGVGI